MNESKSEYAGETVKFHDVILILFIKLNYFLINCKKFRMEKHEVGKTVNCLRY